MDEAEGLEKKWRVDLEGLKTEKKKVGVVGYK